MDHITRLEDVAVTRPRRLLAEEDKSQLKVLDPCDVQAWCDSRIAEYRSRINALHSARNDAAPIHRLLPPELLLEIFANFVPTPTRRRHGLPILRVCRRWRMLVLDTPQFWVNLIAQPLEATYVLPLELARLKFAIPRSANRKLTLSWTACGPAVVDLFLLHADRVCSFTAKFHTTGASHVSRFMRSGLPVLEHLSLSLEYGLVSPIAICVSQFPRLQTLHLVSSPMLIPRAPTLLRELDLLRATFRDPSDSGAACTDIGPILDVLRFMKRLEKLRIGDSLPEDIRETSLSASQRTVQLPLLRTLMVRDDPRAVRVFLAYLKFPSTTKLEIEIQTQHLDTGTLLTPFPPRLATTPASDARVGLVLKLDSSAMSRWEVSVDGVQTLRLTAVRDSATDAGLMEYTREVMAAFAPARLLTSLTIAGAELRGADRAALLADLPRLTRLAVTGPDGRLEGEVLSMLAPGGQGDGQGEGEGGGEVVLCPALEHLSFSWIHTSDRLAWAQDRRVRVGARLHGQRGADDPKTWRPYGAAATHAFCETVASFLARRASQAGSRPLRGLGISIRRPRGDYVQRQWDVPSVRERLQAGLGHLVENISVEYVESG